MEACNNTAAVVPVHEKQEVVPIHYNELKDNISLQMDMPDIIS
jgi:hypothetical protein